MLIYLKQAENKNPPFIAVDVIFYIATLKVNKKD